MRQEDLIEIDEELSLAWRDEEFAALEAEAFDAVIDGAVRFNGGDLTRMWQNLTYMAYDPKRVLRALRDHRDADYEIDPMALMETFMETYDYRYANHVRFVIGNIIGHKLMRSIRTRGTSYWQTLPGRD